MTVIGISDAPYMNTTFEAILHTYTVKASHEVSCASALVFFSLLHRLARSHFEPRFRAILARSLTASSETRSCNLRQEGLRPTRLGLSRRPAAMTETGR